MLGTPEVIDSSGADPAFKFTSSKVEVHIE